MTTPTSSGRTFISYRRQGGAELARLIRDSLQKRGFDVFMDIEDLRSGPFNTALFQEIESSSNVVVVLTPDSLDRCVNENDWLRLEVAHAIKCKKTIIPVMARGFVFPDAPLPPDLAALPNYNGVESSHMYFEASMDKLASLLGNRHRPRAFKRFALGVVAVLACLVGLSTLLPRKPASTVEAITGTNSSATSGPPNLTTQRPPPNDPPPKTKPPRITSQPESQTVKQAASALLQVSVEGEGHMAFVWQSRRNEQEPWSPILNARSNQITLAAVSEQQEGHYRVIVTNEGGAVTSSPALVTVIRFKPPVLTQHPRNVQLTEGETTVLSAAVSSEIEVTYGWQFSGDSGRTWRSLAGANSPAFEIRNAALAMNGLYRLQATSSAGVATSETARVTIQQRIVPAPVAAKSRLRRESQWAFELKSGNKDWRRTFTVTFTETDPNTKELIGLGPFAPGLSFYTRVSVVSPEMAAMRLTVFDGHAQRLGEGHVEAQLQFSGDAKQAQGTWKWIKASSGGRLLDSGQMTARLVE